jgi:hypothetical protein
LRITLAGTFVFVLMAGSLFAVEREILPPLFEPPGLTTGPVTFFPSLNYNLTYSDNAKRADKHMHDDVLQEYRPATEIRYCPTELISLRASYEFGWHDYSKDEAPDYLSHRANLELRLKNFMLEGLNLVFSEHYHQTGNSDPLDNETVSFTRFHTNNVAARAEYATGCFTISGRIYYGLLDYFHAAFESGSYEIVGAEVQGEYRLEPTHITLFGTLSSARTLHETTDRNDYDTHTLLVGAKGVHSKLDYSIAAGYTVADFVHRNDQEEGPSVLASLRYTPTTRLEIYAQARRRFQPATTGGLTTVTDASITARVQVMDRARLLFGLARNESNRTRDGKLVSTEASVTLEYYLARFAALRAGYSHNERSTTDNLPEFRTNETWLGFHFAW